MVMVSTSVWAQSSAPLSSVRPVPRVVADVAVQQKAPITVYYRYKVRPKPRAVVSETAYAEPKAIVKTSALSGQYVLASTVPVYSSRRPLHRPAGLGTRHVTTTQPRRNQTRVASTDLQTTSPAGRICGDRRIVGQTISPIVGEIKGCGVAKPVRVSSIDGVALSQASIMECGTAKALAKWVVKGLKPTIGRQGGGVKSLRIVSHYACRTRNSAKGARISEHGKGKAIDIAAINLNDGSQITVLEGWKSRRQKGKLKKLHKAACGTFGTVLGPDADRHHRDHFHFDTARYGGGPYCE